MGDTERRFSMVEEGRAQGERGEARGAGNAATQNNGTERQPCPRTGRTDPVRLRGHPLLEVPRGVVVYPHRDASLAQRLFLWGGNAGCNMGGKQMVKQ